MVGAIAEAHPDWPEAKVLAELTKAEMGIGEFADLRNKLSKGESLDHAIDLLTEGIVSVKDLLQAKIHETFTVTADRLAQSGDLSREERIELSHLIGDVLSDFDEDFPEEIAGKMVEIELDLEEESLKHEQGETETILWAVRIGDEDWQEELITSTTDPAHLAAAIKWAKENGFDRLRISTYSGEPPDFMKAVLGEGLKHEQFDAVDLLLEGAQFDEIVSLLMVPLAGTGLEKLPQVAGGLFKKGAGAVRAADVKLKSAVGSAVKGAVKRAKKGAEFIKECPKGRERNPTTGKCEPITCPEGYFVDKETGQCSARTTSEVECPGDKYWDTEKQKCVTPTDPKTGKAVTCPEGQQWEPKASACLPEYDAMAALLKRREKKLAKGKEKKALEPAEEPKQIEPKKEPKLLMPPPEKKVAEPGAVPKPGQRCPRGYNKNPKTGACEPREAASLFRDRGWQEWALKHEQDEEPGEQTEIDVDALAEKLGVDAGQLVAGIEVEKEHSDTVGGDIRKIIAIAVDHLAEAPDYYTRLAEMEAGFEDQGGDEQAESFRHEQFMDEISAASDARYYAKNGLSASWIRDSLLRDYPGLSVAAVERIAAEAVRSDWNAA